MHFRDYLNAHPDLAEQYAQLKLELKKQFEHDRDGYTGAKGSFVQKVLRLADQEKHTVETD